MMETWQDLLGAKHPKSSQEFGPETAAALNAYAVLSNTEWLTRVGMTISVPSIIQVSSWDEAFAEFEGDAKHYDWAGQLLQPSMLIQEALTAADRRQWWERAVSESYDYYAIEPYLTALSADRSSWLSEYLYQYISNLLAEIVCANALECTYFRELLPWFHHGHFPCG